LAKVEEVAVEPKELDSELAAAAAEGNRPAEDLLRAVDLVRKAERSQGTQNSPVAAASTTVDSGKERRRKGGEERNGGRERKISFVSARSKRLESSKRGLIDCRKRYESVRE